MHVAAWRCLCVVCFQGQECNASEWEASFCSPFVVKLISGDAVLLVPQSHMVNGWHL